MTSFSGHDLILSYGFHFNMLSHWIGETEFHLKYTVKEKVKLNISLVTPMHR